jgi:hypothetical protein
MSFDCNKTYFHNNHRYAGWDGAEKTTGKTANIYIFLYHMYVFTKKYYLSKCIFIFYLGSIVQDLQVINLD